MLKFKVLTLLISLFLLLTGCSENKEISQSEANKDSEIAVEEEKEILTEEEKAKYENEIWHLLSFGSLKTSWEGTPNGNDEYVQDFEITDIKRDGIITTLTIEVKSNVCIDPDTLKDTENMNTPRAVYKKYDGYEDTGIAVGTAYLTLQEETPGSVFIKNEYHPIEEPAVTYLKGETERLKEELSKSEKIVDKFPEIEEELLRVLWVETLCTRYVEKPQDLTMYDLENLRYLDFRPLNFYSDYGIGEHEAREAYNIEPVRYMKNLKVASIMEPLDDYSVFENMELGELRLWMDNSCHEGFKAPDLGSLSFKKIGNLAIISFCKDMPIDLKGREVTNLSLMSWSSGITEFKGCENVKNLKIEGTKGDMSLLNKSNFPNLETCELYFFSDTPRARDLSGLKTFDENVSIYLTLDYQAANNATIDSLKGVRLDYLSLDPKNGPYPLNEPLREKVYNIDIDEENVFWVSEN